MRRSYITLRKKTDLIKNFVNEFKINDFLYVKLEDGQTSIYVNGEHFSQCKYLMLTIPLKNTKKYDTIESIDEAAEILGWNEEGQEGVEYDIDPKTEFWGHCSNLQAWYEHDYDSRLLHRNLSFPLLKKLTEVGDLLACRVFKEEIAKRILSGNQAVLLYLKDYLHYIPFDELVTLFDNPNSRFYNLLNSPLGNIYDSIEYVLSVLSTFAGLGVPKAQELLQQKLGELELMTDFLNNNRDCLGFLIPIEELRGVKALDRKLPDKLKLVKPFYYDFEKEHLRGDIIPKWWNIPFQFYIKNNHVEGIALLDQMSCESCEHDRELYDTYGEISPGDSIPCRNCGLSEILPVIGSFRELKQLLLSANSTFRNDFIESWLAKLKSLEVLFLYACSSNMWEPVLLGLQSLKILTISESQIRTLPKTIGSLKNLEFLNLEWCYIKTLPETIGNLTNLKTIILDNNQINKLPKSMNQLRNLQVFQLKKNSESYQEDLEEYLEVLCSIPSLQKLYLEKNSFKTIPDCIGNLTNLVELSFTKAPITNLPATIGNLCNLKSLLLEDCKLSSLPDTLTNLSSLEVLNIKGNIFSGLSEKVLNFLLRLKAIPEEDLVYLRVDKSQARLLNEIEIRTRSKLQLVKKIKQRDLTFFSGSGNPDQFSIENNKVVGLRITSYEDVNDLIGKILTLKHLDLERASLNTIPSSFKNLKNLEILRLQGCSIEEIKNLENCAMLRELDLSHNKISEIKNLKNCSLLRELYFSYNNIVKITGLDKLTNLERLNLLYNKIDEITGVDKLIYLKDLELSDNLITEIKGLENLTGIWSLSIESNKIPDNLLTSIIGEEHYSFNGHKLVNYCQNKIVEKQNLQKRFIMYQGNKFYVWNRILRVKNEGLKKLNQLEGLESVTDIEILDLSNNEIAEIKNLNHLIGLKELYLVSNKIEEIKGLDRLTALEILKLDSNNIQEIKGLCNLKNLKWLSLTFNRVKTIKNIGNLVRLEHLSVHTDDKFWEDLKARMGEDFYKEIGMYNNGLQIKNPQKVVEYCKLVDKEKEDIS